VLTVGSVDIIFSTVYITVYFGFITLILEQRKLCLSSH